MFDRGTKIVFTFLIASALSCPIVTTAAEISINRTDGAKGGQRRTVTVSADGIASEISAFNLLIAYDQKMGFVYDIRPGGLHESCGWEYFTYRMINADTVNAHHPGFDNHLMKITGLASLSGGVTASCNLASATLAEIDVLLRHVEGSFSDEEWVWFSFFWRDCHDNVLTSGTGDTLFVANRLFENKSSFNPRDPVAYTIPGFGIPDQPCTGPNGEQVLSTVDFVNSGIWTFVFDPVEECYRGDVNLNGIHFELADAIRGTEFFVWGIPILPWPPGPVLEQLDVNCDGVTLTVSDLVLLIRYAVGHDWYFASPKPAILISNSMLERDYHTNVVNIRSDVDLALIYLRIIPGNKQSLSASEITMHRSEMMTGQIGDTITMLLVDFNNIEVLPNGIHTLFEYSGSVEFAIEGSVVDVYGREAALKLEPVSLPHSPQLSQNYPNPFNPSTTIEFSLTRRSEWQLEIYNVTGQLIKTFSGEGSDIQTVSWDGTDYSGSAVASGVYFYKLEAKDLSLSRKMMLLK